MQVHTYMSKCDRNIVNVYKTWKKFISRKFVVLHIGANANKEKLWDWLELFLRFHDKL